MPPGEERPPRIVRREILLFAVCVWGMKVAGGRIRRTHSRILYTPRNISHLSSGWADGEGRGENIIRRRSIKSGRLPYPTLSVCSICPNFASKKLSAEKSFNPQKKNGKNSRAQYQKRRTFDKAGALFASNEQKDPPPLFATMANL